MNRQELILESEKIIFEIENDIDEGMPLNNISLSLVQDFINNRLKEIESSLEIIKNIDKKFIIELSDIHTLNEASERITIITKKLEEEIELEQFLKTGDLFDKVQLLKFYKNKNLKDKFPNFDINKYFELLSNPIKEITAPSRKKIIFDNYTIKKFTIALNQMIFDEMDLYITNCGKEGSGKSCFSSKILLYFFNIFKYLGLIEYALDIKKMFFSSISSMLDEQSLRPNNDYFRIDVLDEGNDVTKSKFRDESAQDFKFDMRSSRKTLRVVIINIQQLGELDSALSLSRINFIFDCTMTNNVKTGTLKKGIADMIIIPRGEFIYSDKHKRNITRTEILSELSARLDKKKEYYISLPKDIVCHTLEFDDTWGFDKNEYDDFIKNENKKKRSGNNIKTNELIQYILYKKLPPVKKWGTFNTKLLKDKRMYDNFKKWQSQINNYFILNPDKLKIFDNLYSISAEDENRLDEEKEDFEKELDEEENLVPKKFKEEVDFLPDLITEKPKKFYKNLNK